MNIAIISIVVLLVLSVPVAISFGFGSILGVWSSSVKSGMATSVMFQSIDSFPLMAIPFFIVAGELMNTGGISHRLVEFADALMGKVKASLCYVMITACVFFGAVSGSSVATVAAVGGVLLPKMKEKGYNMPVCAALITASGFIGILIPPSITLIVYGVIAGESIAKLFLSTVIPALILATAYVLVTKYLVSKGKFGNVEIDTTEYTLSEKTKQIFKATTTGLPALFMPVLILGGIYGGIFTPTEAAAMAVVYALLAGLFFYREIKIGMLGRALKTSLNTAIVIMFMISIAFIFGRILMMEQIPQQLAAAVMAVTENKYIILLLINIFLLIVGMFMDTNVAILILTPILLPLIKGIGIDPIHFGALLSMNLGIGLVTPPFASNLFVANRISGIPVSKILPALTYYLVFACLPTLILTAYVPLLTTWLPSLVLK